MSAQPQGLKPGVSPSPWDGHPLYSLPPPGWKDQQFDYTFSFLTGDNDNFIRLYYPTGEALESALLIFGQLVGLTEDNVQSPIWPEVPIPPGGILTVDALAGATPFNGLSMRFDYDSFFYVRGVQGTPGASGGDGADAAGFTLVLNGVKRFKLGSELCGTAG